MMDKVKEELKAILDLPVLYTVLAVVVAHFTTNELAQLAAFFILLVIIRKHDSRIPIGFALVLLMLAAFQFAFTTETAANSTAILAYYLLCVGVIAQFIEYIKNPEDEPVEEKEVMPDIPKDIGSTSIALKDITRIIKNAVEKLTGLIKKSMAALRGKRYNNKIHNGIYSAKHDCTRKPEQYSEPGKKMEDAWNRIMQHDKKRIQDT